MKEKNFYYRIILLVFGLVICGFGIGLFLVANLGVDPVSVFQTGLSKLFNISYGSASALSNIILFIIILIIDKKYISIATFLAIFLIGYSADFLMKTLFVLIKEVNIYMGIVLCIIGTFIMSMGIVMYINANMGVGAVDSVSELITEKFKMEYRKVRIFVDISFLVVGYLIGGNLGIGTLIVAFLTGPMVQFIRNKIFK